MFVMKRFLLLFALIFPSLTLSAQVKVNSGSPDVEVEVKRAVEKGGDVYVDLIFTTSAGSLSYIEINTHNAQSTTPGCRFFDDEGTMYQSGEESTMLFEVDGNRTHWFPRLQLEKDVPRKMRIVIKNVDEYATAFQSVRIPYLLYYGRYRKADAEITIKKLPVSR